MCMGVTEAETGGGGKGREGEVKKEGGKRGSARWMDGKRERMTDKRNEWIERRKGRYI